MKHYQVEEDIRKAHTLPGAFYQDAEVWAVQKERVFARSWLGLPHEDLPAQADSFAPVTLLPDHVHEPLILSRNGDGSLSALSNVCTHRGGLLLKEPCPRGTLRCGYHGRTFNGDGTFRAMPGFAEAENFPRPDDDLPRPGIGIAGPLAFLNLDASVKFAPWWQPVAERAGYLPWDELVPEDKPATVYEVNAHWMLYLENYLEGFHIPFVHPELTATLDIGDYPVELFEGASLQLGMAAEGQPTFQAPEGHPDHGKKVAAYYFWLWPNTLINLYPWGLSLNLVMPVRQDFSRVLFKSYLWDASLRDKGAGGPLHLVELQDEAVVESVQQGVRSRLYGRGRFSPEHEQAVHHFQRMMVAALS